MSEHAPHVAAAERFSLRAAQAGLAELAYSVRESPVGELLLVRSGGGLAMLNYLDGELDEKLDWLARRRSPQIVRAPALLDPWARELEEYFAGQRKRFEAPLDWSEISGFQRRVLAAASRIAYGELASYGTLAAAAGSPRASRAAGNALGANPIAIIVPCHRVLHSGGGLGGYTGGLERKRTLLALERSQSAVTEPPSASEGVSRR